MGNSLDLTSAEAKFSNLGFERFAKDNEIADILIDALSGDPKALERPEIQALGVSNIKAALDWLQTADVNGDYKELLLNEGWRLTYKRKPPTPAEYLEAKWIGGQSEGLWPNVKKAFLDFMDTNPLNPKRGLALSTSIGWGKSLLTNLCASYEMVLFGLMREPYRLLGHSQPIYENVKLPDSTYTKISDLKVGMEIAGVTQERSKVLDIIDQGEKNTYELEFENGLKCRCSMDHLWTVFDTKRGRYSILPLRTIIENPDNYLFPDSEDCKRDKDQIVQAEKDFFSEKEMFNFQFVPSANLILRN